MLLCTACRARVLADWTQCKFCGESLVDEAIGANLHPDELVVAAPPPFPEIAAAAQGHAEPAETYDWSNWTNDDTAAPTADASDAAAGDDSGWGSDVQTPQGPPEVGAWEPAESVGAAATWDAPAQSEDTWASPPPPPPDEQGWAPPTDGAIPRGSDSQDQPFGALEPIAGGSTEWIQGPAPADPNAVEEPGPSGLEAVSWYTEPAEKSTTGAGPSLFSGDPGPAHTDVAPPSFADAPAPSFGDAPPMGHVGEPARTSTQVAPVGPRWEAAPDSWATERQGPEEAAKGQAVLSREVRLLAMGIVLILAVSLIMVVVRQRGDSAPANWTGDMGPIAAFVTKQRGVEFKHPVRVEVLAANAFDASVAESGKVTDGTLRQQFADQVAGYRALGLVSGAPEPRLASSTLIKQGDGAYYNLETKRLVVRAGAPTTASRVAIAGSLSIALDDQWHALDELRRGIEPDTPLLAVVDGTSQLIRNAYVEALPDKERIAFQAKAPSVAVDGSEQRDFVEVLTGAPGRLGPPFVQFVHDVVGIERVNQAIALPPSTDNQIYQPPVFFRGTRALQVPRPEVPEGAEELSSGQFGATSWYLLLASRIDPRRSLDTVDGWGGDASVSYRMPNGKVCLALAVRGANEDFTAVFLTSLQYWRDQLPFERVKVASADGMVTVTGCDPGADADQGELIPSGSALDVPVVRSQLAADYYRAGAKVDNGPNGPIFDYRVTWCMANYLVDKVPTAELATVAAERGARYEALTRDAGPKCGSTLVNQLFIESTEDAPPGN